MESKYLLTGMAMCGECGGGMLVYLRRHGKKRAFLYGCRPARVGLCRNDLEVPMPTADAAALSMMSENVLAPDVIDLALKADGEARRAPLHSRPSTDGGAGSPVSAPTGP